MKRILIAILALASAHGAAFGQSKQEAVQKAASLFAGRQYPEVCATLKPVTTDGERDPKVNFYLGAAEAMTGRNAEDAVKRLHLAQLRGFMKSDANLYLGRAYQLMCEYEQARSAFAKFLPTAKDEALAAMARRFDAECESAIQIAGKVFSLRVVAKTKLPASEMLSAYGASREVGSVCRNSRFFQSDIDPDGLMYMTERADAAYFSLPDDAGRDKLMKMEKLIGGWGDMTRLAGIEAPTPADDRTPVLMTDGQTLYFSSNRPGGMGGYDIYRSTYDPDTRTFSEPVNMGVPFNSPYDDYMFLPDEFSRRAWFASNRETGGTDSVTVYQIVWDDSVIRSMAHSTSDIRRALSLPLDPDAVALAHAVSRQAPGQRAKAAPAAPKAQLKLALCDSLTYTRWEHFRSPKAKSLYRQALRSAAEKDSMVRQMAAQRKEFMALTSSLERNAKLQELLQTERSIYALEDEAAEKTEQARNEEIKTLAEQIEAGCYVPLAAIKLKADAPARASERALSPSNFPSYSPIFFQEAKAAEDDDLMAVLTDTERAAVLEQDSLLAWAQILTLEAAQAEDRYLQGAVAQEEANVKKYRRMAHDLTVRAYRSKVSTFESAYVRLTAGLTGYDASELADLHQAAAALASQTAGEAQASDSVAICRRAVAAYERCLMRYAAHADGTFPLPRLHEGDAAAAVTPAATGHESPPAPAPDKAEAAGASPAPVASSTAATDERQGGTSTAATEESSSADYKIQLGAFRSRPALLAKLPNPDAVSSLTLPGRGLTRYYYGAYASAADAGADIQAVRAAGFDGAFVTKVERERQ